MSDRTAKQEQQRISPNHVPTIFHFSVFIVISLSYHDETIINLAVDLIQVQVGQNPAKF